MNSELENTLRQTEVQLDSEEDFETDEATFTAQNNFGVKYLFPWQRLVIANILDSAEAQKTDESFASHHDDDIFCRGRQIVLLPTGAGKSMCFLVPSMILEGPTLVLYPLLALMSDQMRRMEQAKISSVIFKGGQTSEEREKNFEMIKNGAKVIVANPEVLQNEALVKRLAKCKIAHVAIDEAHCVSEWGDSFRPAYLTLGKIIKELGVKIVTAFTATASPTVLKRIGEVLFDGNFHLLQGASDRENIHYEVRYAYAKQKAALECAKTMRRPMIIFCGTRHRTEDMARLAADYFGPEKARFYHAGMTKEEKQKIEKWFFDSKDGILAATCAYGMGVDKSDIYTVVHLDAPNHLENFCQEAGRAGRKGDKVKSVLIWNHADFIRYRQAPLGSRERAMGDFVLNKTCRRQFMLDYLGGEEAKCSGCDICDARNQGKQIDYEASDAKKVLAFIKKNRKLYTREELVNEITEIFNREKSALFGMNIWEAKDSSEIISQLLSEKKIRRLGGLWKNHIDICKEHKIRIKTGRKILILRHHLHSLRQKTLRLSEQVRRLLS
ncbi:RecQ family ATP-dependent DNA helicase [Treponema zioleckii]|uniref:RecQ family ATP-dependent DNA helicase n=1 Tax=Treponema zioleckii TaxID=331680 RepID=UPI00168A4957|nr:RecQ family ATP-dependent DNA helicase [Treponema zioleckii]